MQHPSDGASSTLSTEENELTIEIFEKLFSVAMSKSQTRGEDQEGKSGTFKRKKLSDLSWRGLLRKLFSERSTVTITCECDKRMPKKSAHMKIKKSP